MGQKFDNFISKAKEWFSSTAKNRKVQNAAFALSVVAIFFAVIGIVTYLF